MTRGRKPERNYTTGGWVRQGEIAGVRERGGRRAVFEWVMLVRKKERTMDDG